MKRLMTTIEWEQHQDIGVVLIQDVDVDYDLGQPTCTDNSPKDGAYIVMRCAAVETKMSAPTPATKARIGVNRFNILERRTAYGRGMDGNPHRRRGERCMNKVVIAVVPGWAEDVRTRIFCSWCAT